MRRIYMCSISAWRCLDIRSRRIMQPSPSRSFFFFQAEDGIRDIGVTGVQTLCSSDLLPDFYTLGTSRSTYGDWSLMATDKSQHIDVFGKQELGWIVPRVLKPGQRVADNWRDSKIGRASCRERV